MTPHTPGLLLRAGRRRDARRSLVGFLAGVLLTSTAAWGFVTAAPAAGGSGAAQATTVAQGATPSATVSGQNVTVSWAATTLANGVAVNGYLVRRYDASTLVSQTVLSGCTGTVTGTSCTENNVPGGSWSYSVTPVFAFNWRGAESAKSGAVSVVDTIAPVNNISLTWITGGAYLTGTTAYYRGAAAGSFRVTNAVSDISPASSQTSALTGVTTGWAHAPSTVSTPASGPYESNPFSWAAATTSGPQAVVTGRDVAGNTASTTLTFVNDSTLPAATLSYADGFTSGRSVSVTLTASDGGSGVLSRQLQRAKAPMTGGACGTYRAFTDRGAPNPTSPYVDSGLSGGACYKYRYVVTDRVGNQQIATSVNVVKADYAGAVNSTPGLLSHWRLGESAATLTATDSLEGATGSQLNGRTGDIGTWAFHGGTSSALQQISEGRTYRNGAGYSINRITSAPPSTDYSVEADLHVKSNLAGDMAGVIGRLNTASNQFYMARWESADNSWRIVKFNNGAVTYPNFVAAQPALLVGHTYRLRLEISGASPTTLNLYVNGVLKVTATDSAAPVFTAAGFGGIMDGNSEVSVTKSSTTGLHLDNVEVTPSTYSRAVDSKGSNTGDYQNGPVLGQPGALAGDTNTAVRFDGVNDHVQMTGTTGLPTGAGIRSTELWFKTSSTARQVLFRYGSGAATQEYGLWLNSGGAGMTAWGFGTGNDKVFPLAAAVNDGAWHQVVLTYDGTSLTLYVDGAARPTQAATRNTVIDSYGFGIGGVIRPNDADSGGFFNGWIDEVSFYTTVLSQATVADHYGLGASAADLVGPTGGSVDASGLVGTGSRYSTSTTLSLVLSPGSDPSGFATSGAELRRATATLSSGNGTCGTYGTFTLVAGGTDPVSPKSETVADQACYRYEYVVSDSVGNTTTYTSPDIKVDTTAPATPTLTFSTFTNTYWSGSGSTVFYRPVIASGSFRITAAATDTASGISSYTFPALGTGWTSTAVSSGVTTYSWSALNPAAPGTKNVTATNNAALVSPNAPFTPTADSTAPTAGTITYAGGATTSTSIPVSFTTGTDSGSGMGTRFLQQATAPLTGTTCGTFGSYVTVTGSTNVASPFTVVVARGACYMFRYVTRDNVGNQHIATGVNIVQVTSGYATTVSATAGLVNYWRLDEATTSADSMTGTTGATLQSRSGETAAAWTKHALSTDDALITAAGRVRKGGTATTGALYYTSGVPASADYTVGADVYVGSNLADDLAGVVGRLDPASATGTFYGARYEQAVQRWSVFKVVNGTGTVLAQSAVEALTVGATYRLALDMTGSNIRAVVNGAQVAAVTDTAITAAGRGGIRLGFAATGTSVTDAAGLHLDNFQVSPQLADSKGTAHADCFGGLTLGVAGAITGDSNKAAQFDGINDFASAPRQIADDFSIEFWFKSTQGIGTSTNWWQGAGLVDGSVSGAANDFGVALRSDGRVVAGVGTPDVSIVSTSASFNNGAWHHVVFTRVRSTGALALYVDGSLEGTATGNTLSLTAPTVVNLGRIVSSSNYFLGALDEVALYSVALSASTVTAHRNEGL